MLSSPPGPRACRVVSVQRFSIHDGPGIRTTVFFAGCPLRCGWCHNPEAFEAGAAPSVDLAQLVDEVLADRDYHLASGGGLTVSGGEPLLHLPTVRGLLAAVAAAGVSTCVQTSAAVPRDHLAAVLDVVDLFQVDLKHMDAARHRSLTGAGNERILDNLAFLLERARAVEVRMPLLPGLNDDPENVARTARFVRDHGQDTLHLVPYHALYLDKYRALGVAPGVRPTRVPDEDDLRRVAGLFARAGVEAAAQPSRQSPLARR